MQLRVTRPGFIRGIQRFASSDAPVPHLPVDRALARRRQGASPTTPTPTPPAPRCARFVCGQCHVEYYCSTKMPLTFPWGKGLRVEQIEAFWDETKFPDGERFFDYKHAETGRRS